MTGKPAVRIPYLGVGGEELAVRFRIALEGRPLPVEVGQQASASTGCIA